MTPTEAWAVLDRDGNIRSVRLRDCCEDYYYTNREVPVLIVPRPSADGVQTEVLHALLAECFRKHHGGWNDESSDSEPCPLSYDDPEPGETCSCGASAWNARVDAVLHGTPVLIVPRPESTSDQAKFGLVDAVSGPAPSDRLTSDVKAANVHQPVRTIGYVQVVDPNGPPPPKTTTTIYNADPDPVVAALREVREKVNEVYEPVKFASECEWILLQIDAAIAKRETNNQQEK